MDEESISILDAGEPVTGKITCNKISSEVMNFPNAKKCNVGG